MSIGMKPPENKLIESKRAHSTPRLFDRWNRHPPPGSFALSQYPIDPFPVHEKCAAIGFFDGVAHIFCHVNGFAEPNGQELIMILSWSGSDVIEQPLSFQPNHSMAGSGWVVGP
jgi:hypothetical protein